MSTGESTDALQTLRDPELYYLDHDDISPPLHAMRMVPPSDTDRKREINPSNVKPLGPLSPPPVGWVDPLVALSRRPAPEIAVTTGLNFDGVGKGLGSYSPSSAPPDTNGAAGTIQYVQWVNTAFAVFNKHTGALLYGPAAGNTLWQGFGGLCESSNNGDPIATYDKLANRWVMTQFAFDVGAASQFQKGDETVVAEDHVRLLYTRRDAKTGRLFITGSFCRLDLSDCWDAPEWATGTATSLWHAGDTFNPNLRAFPGFIGLTPAWRANYITRDDAPTGNQVRLKQGNLVMLPNGARVFLSFPLTDAQVVCSDTRGYWGDYDDLQFSGVTPSLTPRFVRAFTDSFKGCASRTTYEAREVHAGAAVSPE